MQAINLLRHDGPRATLIERRARPGEGLAYGDAAPDHLLNVRARGMNALPDDPASFVGWLSMHYPALTGDSFVPRLIYGQYLRDLLTAETERQPGRLSVVHGEAVSLSHSQGTTVELSDGRSVTADLAILAVGNLPPHHPTGFRDGLPSDCYAANPWADSATSGLEKGDTVLILGTGLTMVDMALRLEAEGFAGPIIALSRRGLLPHRHGEQRTFVPIGERPEPKASALLQAVRSRAGSIGWRNAVDELRPFTQSLWRAADHATRGRFLRHLRPWWDIHRHRLAPSVADRIARLIERGQLRIAAGGTRHAEPTTAGLRVTYRPRGAGEEQTLTVRRAINCTGPQGNLLSATDPLLRSLTAKGMIRPDFQKIGIDVDAASRTISEGGRPNNCLYAIGPMTRGANWEITAVPDIRQQVWALARRLSNAHWVGGEGL